MEYTAAEQKKYKQASIGTHTGVCFLIADLGTQEETYEGKTTKSHRICFGFELPEELDDNGKPVTVFKEYTLSFHEKATLLKDYKAWTKDPKPEKYKFDPLLGAGCNLNIGHTSAGNAKVTGLSALKASEKVPNLVNEPVCFDLRKPSQEAYDRLPTFLQNKIQKAPEFTGNTAHIEGADKKPELDDEIPF